MHVGDSVSPTLAVHQMNIGVRTHTLTLNKCKISVGISTCTIELLSSARSAQLTKHKGMEIAQTILEHKLAHKCVNN